MLDTLTGTFDRRFVVNALLPALAFLSLILVVPMTRYGLAETLAVWERQSESARALFATGFLIGGVVLAVVLSASAPAVLTAAQGGWPAGIGRRFRPTTLAYALRDAGRYPASRYGIDAAVTWPRLYAVVPESWAAVLGATRAAITFHLTVAALSGALGIAAAAVLLATDAPWWLVLAWYWTPAAAAWAAYRAAVASTRTYATYTATTFDLYRRDLLTQIGNTEPETPELWQRLAFFWHRNIPLDAVLAPAAPASTPPAIPSRPAAVPPAPAAPRLSVVWAITVLTTGVLAALAAAVR